MIERRDFLQTAIGTVSAMAIPALHRASANVIAEQWNPHHHGWHHATILEA